MFIQGFINDKQFGQFPIKLYMCLCVCVSECVFRVNIVETDM